MFKPIRKYIDTYNNKKFTVKVYKVNKILTDEEIENKVGDYYDEKHYKLIIKHNADVYDENDNILIKIRKKIIPKKLRHLAIDCYAKTAKKFSTNRGASSGKLDKKKMSETAYKFIEKDALNKKMRVQIKYVNTKGKKGSQNISNFAPSNIVGYFDRYIRHLPRVGHPCRLTAFTKNNPILWDRSIPFVECIDKIFKHLFPLRHKKQYDRGHLTPDFMIKDTAYSTLTVNYSWRTALHKDAGDYEDGFGNIIVCKDYTNPNDYTGCYTGLPQYGVAFDCRDGDYAGFDVHQYHCNTEIIPVGEFTEFKKKTKKNECMTLNNWVYNRMSIVAYLRKNMAICAEKV